jgi:hypothetical protein
MISIARKPDLTYCQNIIERVCDIAGPRSLIRDIRQDLDRAGVANALHQHNDRVLFAWFLKIFSLQGVSDQAAISYLDRHGIPELLDLYFESSHIARCSLLRSYWNFDGCGYRKSALTCNNPALLSTCPLPEHPLRNGRLNQTAFSLALFIRDIAQDDLSNWLSNQTKRVARNEMNVDQALIEPFAKIYGASDKVVRLAISDLMLGAGLSRHSRKIGAEIVVVDRLVHNFLQRTGILTRLEATHLYGQACYHTNHCIDILRMLSKLIDANSFNRTYPSYFPRFVQKAIWNYCANGEFNICNGNEINDRHRCENRYCTIYQACDRIKLAK